MSRTPQRVATQCCLGRYCRLDRLLPRPIVFFEATVAEHAGCFCRVHSRPLYDTRILGTAPYGPRPDTEEPLFHVCSGRQKRYVNFLWCCLLAISLFLEHVVCAHRVGAESAGRDARQPEGEAQSGGIGVPEGARAGRRGR